VQCISYPRGTPRLVTYNNDFIYSMKKIRQLIHPVLQLLYTSIIY